MNQAGTFKERRFPRIAHVSSRQIIRLDDAQITQQNLVMTKNLSPVGVCFATSTELTPGSTFLIYLNNVEVEHVCSDTSRLIKAGDHYLARVVWAKPVENNCFEIGASFFEREKSSLQEVELLTELVNASALEEMPTYAS